MIFVALTILSSVLVSVILKINEGRDGHRLVVAGTNYVVAALLALLFGGTGSLGIGPKWIAISLAAGIGFIAGFLILMIGLRRIGLAIPTSAARLSMLVPVTGSIVAFGEQPSPMQIAGIGAGVCAFVLLGLAQRTGGRSAMGPATTTLDFRSIGILVSVFCIVGTTDFTMKSLQHAGVNSDGMAFFIFVSAALCCWIPVIVRRTAIRRHDLLLACALAIPNYFSVYFLLAALRHLDASVVFPTVSAGAVVAITLVAVVFWRERPNRTAWVGILLAALAVMLLGLREGGMPQ